MLFTIDEQGQVRLPVVSLNGGSFMNQNEMLLLKLGEVVLKGLNRRSFEDKLVSNVRRRMKPCGSFQIYIRQSTI